ncbi:hypothetical protein D9758_015336 [Tetrapyrgos nigripes]|uniref:DUF6535 domain-containing protein n=1 Tax=Tetrapyrgos nigripes TaxID=182062 RepID=A0A8H5CLN3_9AGAR|nr:hypothetical protein D9758_015336 [Tetrapyrgos nigripes]
MTVTGSALLSLKGRANTYTQEGSDSSRTFGSEIQKTEYFEHIKIETIYKVKSNTMSLLGSERSQVEIVRTSHQQKAGGGKVTTGIGTRTFDPRLHRLERQKTASLMSSKSPYARRRVSEKTSSPGLPYATGLNRQLVTSYRPDLSSLAQTLSTAFPFNFQPTSVSSTGGAMLHSIYNLTTQCCKTTGDVSVKLVGASTTVVRCKMYLFRGRLVMERRMVLDLYVFDLETFSWERMMYPNRVIFTVPMLLTLSQALHVQLTLLQIPMSGNDSDLESAHEAVGQESTQKSGIDEEACSKFWNVYIEEAQKYDKALLEGWREDMAGMLYLLTAFLFESYQTLQEDPAVTTVVLLQRISEQLTPGSNGAPVTSLMTFHPPAAALACNIMWFLSLALALTCSLLATFMQQWTRDFLHKTTMRHDVRFFDINTRHWLPASQFPVPASDAFIPRINYSSLAVKFFSTHGWTTYVEVHPVEIFLYHKLRDVSE